MPTPVETWAPAFAPVLKEITPETILRDEDWRVPLKRWCRLCETWVPFGELKTHADAHERERAAFFGKGRGVAGLRQINRDRAPGDGRGDDPSPGGRPSGATTTERNAMATNDKAETAKADGHALFEALLSRIGSEKVGTEIKVHKDGKYARVFVDDKRHAGYVVAGKTKVNVYPQALAADMPKSLGFKKVKLGSHHYGRGEVIVPIDSESDFDAAVEALKATATKLTAAEAEPKAEPKASGNGAKAEAKPDPKKKGAAAAKAK